MLLRVIDRIAAVPGINQIVVALPDGEDQSPILDAIRDVPNVTHFQGSEKDVLKRTADAARSIGAGTVVRITSDCPFIDPDVSGALLAAWKLGGFDYGRLPITRGFPLGFDTEVLSAALLYRIADIASDPYDREHVTPYIWKRPEEFRTLYMDQLPDLRHWRLVVDTPDDYRLAEEVYNRLGARSEDFRLRELIELFSADPALLDLNADSVQTRYENAPEGA